MFVCLCFTPSLTTTIQFCPNQWLQMFHFFCNLWNHKKASWVPLFFVFVQQKSFKNKIPKLKTIVSIVCACHWSVDWIDSPWSNSSIVQSSWLLSCRYCFGKNKIFLYSYGLYGIDFKFNENFPILLLCWHCGKVFCYANHILCIMSNDNQWLKTTRFNLLTNFILNVLKHIWIFSPANLASCGLI